MSFDTLIATDVGVDVTIVTPATTTDGYGDTILDWDNATTATTRGKYTRASEDRDRSGRDALITTDRLDLPATVTIDGRCRVIVAGQTRELDGEPYEARGRSGVSHIVCRLRTVEG